VLKEELSDNLMKKEAVKFAKKDQSETSFIIIVQKCAEKAMHSYSRRSVQEIRKGTRMSCWGAHRQACWLMEMFCFQPVFIQDSMTSSTEPGITLGQDVMCHNSLLPRITHSVLPPK
jgi:hypothetical protein